MVDYTWGLQVYAISQNNESTTWILCGVSRLLLLKIQTQVNNNNNNSNNNNNNNSNCSFNFCN